MSVAAVKKNIIENADCRSCHITGVANLCKGTEESLQLIEKAKTSYVLNKAEKINFITENRKSLFLVRQGVIKLHTRIDDNESIELLYKGSFFGGFDYLGKTDIEVIAEAGCETHLCELGEDVLQNLFQTNSQFLKRYLFFLGLYISGLKKDKIELQSKKLVTLLAKSLQRDFKERGYTYKGKITVTKILSQTEWATLFGARRESITRAFSELEKQKIIACNTGSISLIDETALVRLLLANK